MLTKSNFSPHFGFGSLFHVADHCFLTSAVAGSKSDSSTKGSTWPSAVRLRAWTRVRVRMPLRSSVMGPVCVGSFFFVCVSGGGRGREGERKE